MSCRCGNIRTPETSVHHNLPTVFDVVVGRTDFVLDTWIPGDVHGSAMHQSLCGEISPLRSLAGPCPGALRGTEFFSHALGVANELCGWPSTRALI